MQQLIFATGNKAKLAQIRYVATCLDLPIEILNGRELFGDMIAYEEIGDTVEQVALNGALAVSKLINKPVITEDTDFRVDALSGEPGIRAGAYLKEFGRSAILRRMDGETNRRAQISSAVGFAMPDGMNKVFTNIVSGSIATSERFGDFPDWIAPSESNSFGGGYNAIFIPNAWDRSLAEISPAEAIPWSYRERNFTDVLRFFLYLKEL